MGLLFRFISYLVRSLLAFFGAFLGVILRILFWQLARLARLLFAGVVSLERIAFGAALFGPRQSIERIANNWTQRLIAQGASTDNIDFTYRFFRFMATFTLVFGWLIGAVIFASVIYILFWISGS